MYAKQVLYLWAISQILIFQNLSLADVQTGLGLSNFQKVVQVAGIAGMCHPARLSQMYTLVYHGYTFKKVK